MLSAITYDFVGIGEEAVSRDLEYKELDISLGILPAKLINAVTFPALHVSQEIQAGYSAGQILLDFGFRSGATFGLQWAYDKGGLPKAVALHMWVDTAASLIDYLLESGTPSALAVSFSVKLKMAGWKSRAPLRDTLRTVSRCRRPGGASSRGGVPGSRYSQAVLMR